MALAEQLYRERYDYLLRRQDQVEMKLAQVEQRVEQRVNFNVALNTAEKDVEVKEETFGEAEGGAAAEVELGGPAGVAHREREAEPVEEGEGRVAAELPSLVRDEDEQRALLTTQLAWLTKNLTQYETISRMRRIDQSERMAALTDPTRDCRSLVQRFRR